MCACAVMCACVRVCVCVRLCVCVPMPVRAHVCLCLCMCLCPWQCLGLLSVSVSWSLSSSLSVILFWGAFVTGCVPVSRSLSVSVSVYICVCRSMCVWSCVCMCVCACVCGLCVCGRVLVRGVRACACASARVCAHSFVRECPEQGEHQQGRRHGHNCWMVASVDVNLAVESRRAPVVRDAMQFVDVPQQRNVWAQR